MKKALCLLITALLAVALFGCYTDGEGNGDGDGEGGGTRRSRGIANVPYIETRVLPDREEREEKERSDARRNFTARRPAVNRTLPDYTPRTDEDEESLARKGSEGNDAKEGTGLWRNRFPGFTRQSGNQTDADRGAAGNSNSNPDNSMTTGYIPSYTAPYPLVTGYRVMPGGQLDPVSGALVNGVPYGAAFGTGFNPMS